MGRLADESHISPSSLSDHIAGRRHNPSRQQAILDAFNRLTGSSLRGKAFWGSLWKEGQRPEARGQRKKGKEAK
jgi:hypothetical protein